MENAVSNQSLKRRIVAVALVISIHTAARQTVSAFHFSSWHRIGSQLLACR